MSDEELIKLLATEVMGWHLVFKDIPVITYCTKKVPTDLDDIKMIRDKWNPLTNSNHTDMVRHKLAEMGFGIDEHLCKVANSVCFNVEIWNPNRSWMLDKEVVNKSTNLTRCRAYYEAYTKMKGEINE